MRFGPKRVNPRTKARRCGASCALLVLSCLLLPYAAAGQPLDPGGIVKKAMAENKVPGAAFAVSKNGKIIHSGAFGVADLRHGVPVKEETVFDLASITKQFVSAAILLLEQDGELSIDDPIDKYIDGCPEFCKRVTVRHLLNHTSGVPGIDENWEMMEKEYGERMEYSDDQWLAVFSKGGLVHEPGERWDYSDIGYYVLGLIINKVSGIPSGEFLEKRFFEPLGMKNTYTEDEDRITPNEADGYVFRDGKYLSNRRDWDRATIGSGGVFSTIGDLVKWDDSLARNRILSKASTEKLFAYSRLNNGADSNYALGWYVNDIFGIRVHYHTGSTGAEIIRIPEKGLFIVVLSNLDGVGVGATEIAEALVPELLPKPFLIQPTGGSPDEYAGKYRSVSGTESAVTFSQGVLKFRFSDQFVDELQQYAFDNVFLSKETPRVQYRFERDGSGKVIRMYMVNHWYYNFPQTKVG
ncbi:MAG: beta-lactamase family protein [Aridibacter famidurans]|nr:beta-lactamase family protein [Aridibacter famidurans]